MTIPSPAEDSAASKCIECSAAISAKAKFCEECGAIQAAPPTSSSEPDGEVLLDSTASGIAPLTSETQLLSSATTNQTSNPPAIARVDNEPSTQKKPFKILGIAALVIVLVCIGAWYLRATERQKATDNYNLGLAYENGQGVPKDEAQAVSWFRKAAEQGNADAQERLGEMYSYGQGGLAKDEAQAVSWYRKAAEQGNEYAQSNLGAMYVGGIGGLPVDHAQAVSWWRKAAAQGNAYSQYLLGMAYEYGEGGLAKDDSQAVSWYQKAADQGYAPAKDVPVILLARRQREQQEQARMNALMGEPSGFESFMVEFRTRELQIGKRYRFQATPGYADELRELCNVGSPGGTACIPATPDFDDPAQFKYTISSLIRKFNTSCTVTASMGIGGTAQIHRVEG